MVVLLRNAVESTTGDAINVRGLMGNATRFRARGSNSDGSWTGDSITVEGSMTTQGSDWVSLGTIANTPGSDLVVTSPVERVRAKTGSTDTAATNVSVYMETFREFFD